MYLCLALDSMPPALASRCGLCARLKSRWMPTTAPLTKRYTLTFFSFLMKRREERLCSPNMKHFPSFHARVALSCTLISQTSSVKHRWQGQALPFHCRLSRSPAPKLPLAGTVTADHGSNRFPCLQVTSWDHFPASPSSDHLLVFKISTNLRPTLKKHQRRC